MEVYMESHLGKRRLAYDGGCTAYAAGALPFKSEEFVINMKGNDHGHRREQEFKVAIKFASKLGLEHLRQILQGRQCDAAEETITTLNVVLGATSSSNKYEVDGAFFSPDFGRGTLGNGIQYWKGFHQSIRPIQMGLSLNVYTSARAYYDPIFVSDYVAKILGKDNSEPLSDQERDKIKRVLKGVRVETTHQRFVETQIISGISTKPLRDLTFSDDETGATTSVLDDFQSKYDISPKFLLLPAIQVGPDAKPTYLPMEICKINKGQRYIGKLNGSQNYEMLKATCKPPAVKKQEIQKMVNTNNYNQDLLADEFGIKLSSNMVSIDARVLPAPDLKFHHTGKEPMVKPSVGQWNMKDKKVVDGARVSVWTCVNFSKQRDDDVIKFCNELVSMCTSIGIDLIRQPVIPIRSTNPSQITNSLCEIHSQMKSTGKQPELLIVILPDETGQYGTIKRVCETELGIVSQCLRPINITNVSQVFLANVALKINVKVGGRNTVLQDAFDQKLTSLTDQRTIIFGADVSHRPTGEDSSSIAAVVASMDWPGVSKYSARVSAQPRGQEIIENLYHSYIDPVKGVVHSGMIRELLMAHFQIGGQQPTRIIFYRDGVSDSQFNQVLLAEVEMIKKACDSLSPQFKYRPRITFMVVVKRHHTRFFPANQNDTNLTNGSGNILPGTVVDMKICHPSMFDFYLCSHAGIKGTSRPAHYYVLYDENNFTADELQGLTNSLCSTHATCTRSISIVPAAYYAHQAADRARYYTARDGGGDVTGDQLAAVRPLPAIHDNVKNSMFYC